MSTRTVETGPFRPGDRHAVAARQAGTRARYRAWLLVRLTGLLLSVLVLGHFALTHIVTDVADTGSAFVARRWGSAFWLAWDWLMLVAALAHGGAGVWIAIGDYAPARPRRGRLRGALLAAVAVAFVLGSITIARATLG
ncbi:MAG TPA: hypothetical protein VFL91_27010 [Thermomicrobiales bacterium]|nr:hypothetical protein [Thermomicrobiales bacterium]